MLFSAGCSLHKFRPGESRRHRGVDLVDDQLLQVPVVEGDDEAPREKRAEAAFMREDLSRGREVALEGRRCALYVSGVS